MTAYDDNPYTIRAWVLNTLRPTFPVGCNVGVNQTRRVHADFLKWTGHTFDSLVTTWKTKPRYSTCADFLYFVNKILCEKNITRQGAQQGFDGFGLNKCGRGRGWHAYQEIYRENGPRPKSGDFYQIHQNNSHETQHVGVLLDYRGNLATYLSGGGGQIGVEQKITCVTDHFPPRNFMGWLDIDEYYH